MSRVRFGRGLRWGALALTTIVVANAVMSDPAEARRRRHRAAAPAYQPAYSSIVVDANTGAVLQSTNGDAQRHPASLTKIMTLYLLFEKLEAKKISLASRLPVSAHAASQAPSKLDLKPGETIDVESAIRAIVTKSANDVAVVVAEALGGDEESFAKQMTHKARMLGMKSTVYRNASGLPNEEQLTTARDQVTLGRAIQDRFPRYYSYFQTRNFVFHGKNLRNHNKLLGQVEGVDGIKTGFTNASGFNLVTSVRRAGRHVVAAVFGGRTGRARDAQMQGLIDKFTKMASVKRTAPMIAEQPDGGTPQLASAERKAVEAKAPEPKVAEAKVQEPKAPAAKEPVDTRALRATAYAPEVGSNDPIRPTIVKTLTVKGGSAMQTASLAPPAPTAAPVKTIAAVPASKPEVRIEKPVEAKTEPKSIDRIVEAKTEPKPTVLPPPPGARPGILGVLPVHVASADASTIPARESVQPPSPAPVPAPVHASTQPSISPAAATPARSGWFIQVGALETEKEAKERLQLVRHTVKSALKGAEAYTEIVTKGSKTFYRARFAGFSEADAENACKQIKANKIVCITARN